MKKLISLLALLSFLLACDKYSDNLTLDNNFILSCGDCLNDPQNQFYICFDSVLNDSRCPTDVLCFWQGNAEAEFKLVKYNEPPVLFTLNTCLGFVKDTVIKKYKITFVGLKPYPDSHHRIKQRQYKAELVVSKN
jgi:hypothetical protein